MARSVADGLHLPVPMNIMVVVLGFDCMFVIVDGLNSEDWVVLLVILFVAEIVSLVIGDRLNRMAAALGKYFCKSSKEEKQQAVIT